MSEENELRRDAERELRALKREAKQEWENGRRVCESTRFIGKSALTQVARMVESLYSTIDGRDILKAVREISRDPNGTPWDVRDTAQRLESSRLELEHVARKRQERADAEAHPMDYPRLGRMP